VKAELAVILPGSETGQLLGTGEQATTHQVDERRARIAAEDVDALASPAIVAHPGDGDAVGGTLAVVPEGDWAAGGAQLLLTDDADAGQGVATYREWLERRRQKAGGGGQVQAVVHEHAAPDDAADRRLPGAS
jgi:hypothetical protein